MFYSYSYSSYSCVKAIQFASIYHSILYTGYDVTVGGPPGCKKPCVITMQCPSACTVFMALSDHNELTMWFNVLERETKMESIMRQQQMFADKRTKMYLQPSTAVCPLPHTAIKMKKKAEQRMEALSKDTKVSYTFYIHV